MQNLIERYKRQKDKYEAELNGLLQQIIKELPKATIEEKKALAELGIELPKDKIELSKEDPKRASR